MNRFDSQEGSRDRFGTHVVVLRSIFTVLHSTGSSSTVTQKAAATIKHPLFLLLIGSRIWTTTTTNNNQFGSGGELQKTHNHENRGRRR
jgi:hypothetical protein